MPPLYEIKLYHSGVMDCSGLEPVYVGGKSDTVYIDHDSMCYYELKHSVGIGFVEYKFIEGIWYLEPNKSMGEGLHKVRNDYDVKNGLVGAIASDLKITIFMTGFSINEYGADNEDGTMGDIEDGANGDNDPYDVHTPPENSVVGPEFTHLLGDELRTTDDEFEDALFTIGVRRTKRRVAYMAYSSGEEVEQGLVASLNTLMPYAEHRKCARHVFANWKIKHTQEELRELFWEAVYTCNQSAWRNKMEVLQILENDETGTKKPCKDFLDQDPKTFCRAFMSSVPKCDSVESNICETFNSVIVKCRGRRILDMLEEIRLYAMKRVVKKHKLFARCTDVICPRIRTILENAKIRSRNCLTFPTLNGVCEVKEFGDGYVVDLRNNTCSCGYFTLSGIPCNHAVAAIAFMRLKLEDHVDPVYHTERVMQAYGYGVPAIVGRQAWPPAEGYDVLPPLGKRMPGRPKKVRRKEAAELQGRPRKSAPGFHLSRRGMIMHCRTCRREGHNSRNCPDAEQPMADPLAEAVPPGATVGAVDDMSVRPRTEGRTNTDPVHVREEAAINPQVGEASAAQRPARKKSKCKTCGFTGHNSRTCPSKSGVQPMAMNVQARRVVERETGIAQTGYGVAYFPETGNTYFATGNNGGGVEPTRVVTRARTAAVTDGNREHQDVIDLTPAHGTRE
ncbi:hypothetical protein LINPERHAP1_LOCUS15779 [Linum perenne]